MKKKELEALAEELGADLTNDGPRWIATFSDIPSIVHEGPVELRGTRADLGQQLTAIKEWRVLRHGDASIGSFVNGIAARPVQQDKSI